jgi:hypothetical protein
VDNVRYARQSESRRLALLGRQLEELARHARELEFPAELVLQRLTRWMESDNECRTSPLRAMR